VAGAVLALCSLTGCGSDDPAVCTSLDELRSSLGNIEDVQLGENGLVELQNILVQVKADAEQVVADAGQQYDAQLTTVTDAVAALDESAQAAKDDPSASTIETFTTSLAEVGTGLSSLQEAVAGTC
jgi:predicted pyridoxine 5'-phosphate oxidase superfamily flavin-nucleotide-binding protein